MTLEMIELHLIREFITTVDHGDIVDLVKSVAENGVLTPITVRQVGEEYVVLNGRCRVLASRRCGYHQIPAHVLNLTDEQVEDIKCMTAIHRVPVKENEFGNAIERLLKQGYTWGRLSEKLNTSVKRLKTLHDKRDK